MHPIHCNYLVEVAELGQHHKADHRALLLHGLKGLGLSDNISYMSRVHYYTYLSIINIIKIYAY